MPELQKLPLNERAYQEILERIITLKLSPGIQMDESSLEQLLSIGRTPIREALFRLTAEGLVEKLPQRSFFVKSITIDDVKSFFEAMMFSERSCAVLAARRVQKDHINQLQRVQRQIQGAMNKRDYLKMTLLNFGFHRIIHEATDNRYLCSSLNHLRRQAQRLAYLAYSKEMAPNDLKSYLSKVTEHHQTIISLLKKKDEQGLVIKITEHIQLFYSRVVDYMSPSIDDLNIILESDLAKQ
jgi:DNA-binding GntR family transcriptional regulator